VTKPILSLSFLYILVITTGAIFIGWFSTITFSEAKIENSYRKSFLFRYYQFESNKILWYSYFSYRLKAFIMDAIIDKYSELNVFAMMD